MATQACRIIITQEASGLVNVSAPMQYKALCYDILWDAAFVIDHTPPQHFFSSGKTLLITMGQDGRVDVAAPLPPRDWCHMMLKAARLVIEQYEAGDTPMRRAGFADSLPTP